MPEQDSTVQSIHTYIHARPEPGRASSHPDTMRAMPIRGVCNGPRAFPNGQRTNIGCAYRTVSCVSCASYLFLAEARSSRTVQYSCTPTPIVSLS